MPPPPGVAGVRDGIRSHVMRPDGVPDDLRTITPSRRSAAGSTTVSG
ncbi:hypothetical protein HS041_26890 [Planomonospora sp. ID67723]|nr:hypothetical protein [Planomonospora sp. ID67723]MBG0831377.1 hypothetical protein [Planomonospora sp. ID67723]